MADVLIATGLFIATFTLIGNYLFHKPFGEAIVYAIKCWLIGLFVGYAVLPFVTMVMA